MPLVARANVSPPFVGFNGPVPAAPLRVDLNGSATGGTPPYEFAWNVGDGPTSDSQNTTYTFSVPGTYTAVLTVTDNAGATATGSAVSAAISIDGVHWVIGTADPALGSVPLAVHFSVTGMGEVPASTEWAFGDGVSAASEEANHTYARAGTYVAQLNVTDSDGAKATYRMTVIALSGVPLAALATSSVVGLCNGNVWNRVSFRGFAGGGTSPYAFAWHFGEDNATSTLQNPTYSYAVGIWPNLANLTVTDAAGSVATTTVPAFVVPPPCAPLITPPWLWLGAVVVVGATVVAVALWSRKRSRAEPLAPFPPPPP